VKNKITLLIREKEGLSLPQYAKSKNINLQALRRVIYKNDFIEVQDKEDNSIIYKKNTLCRVKKSKEYKARKQLVKDGYIHIDSLRFNSPPLLIERKKIISKLMIHYNLSIKSFYEKNEKYFKKHDIKLNYIYVYISGIGIGLKENTKAYFIKKKFQEYSLLTTEKNNPHRESSRNEMKRNVMGQQPIGR